MLRSFILRATKHQSIPLLHHFNLHRGLHSRNKKALEFIAKGFSALQEVDRVIDYTEPNDPRLFPLLRTAKENFELALEADNGNTHARYWLARMHLKYQVPGACKAIGAALLVEAADMGDPDALYELGCRLRVENENVQSDQQAFYYLEKAVDQLHPGALYLLGAVYLTGDCVKKDIASALWCFHRASEKWVKGIKEISNKFQPNTPAEKVARRPFLPLPTTRPCVRITLHTLNHCFSDQSRWPPFHSKRSSPSFKLFKNPNLGVNHESSVAKPLLFSASSTVGSPNEGLEVPSPGFVGKNDILIVGPGVLGRIVAEQWRKGHAGAAIAYGSLLLKGAKVPEALTRFNSKKYRPETVALETPAEDGVELASEQFQKAAEAGCDLGFQWLKRLEDEEKAQVNE